MELKNKVAIVTGSSSGIGEAIALELAQIGCKVVVNCRNSEKEAERIVTEIRDNGGEAIFIKADVSKKEEVEKLFSKTIEKFGAVDILINNASKQGGSDFLTTDNNEWLEHFNNDFLSAVMCSQEFVKLKTKTLRKIVNISSLYGFGEFSCSSFMPYSAAKAALNNFTQNLAKLVAPDVLVNTVAPGYTLTPHWNSLSEDVIKSCVKSTLIKRMIKPEEIADAVKFLIENDAITGQTVMIDGGLSLQEY
jgi:NAD(P)-dependent dehydrogenase (short-subunit alcohol dehydrogenase family)